MTSPPKELATLKKVDGATLKKVDGATLKKVDGATLKKIDRLREQIDHLDRRLITLLKKRFQIVRQIGTLKKEMGLPVFQKSRWTQLMRDRIKRSRGPNGRRTLSVLFIRDLFTLIHSESLDLQEKLKNYKVRKKVNVRSENETNTPQTKNRSTINAIKNSKAGEHEKSKNMESKQLALLPGRAAAGIPGPKTAH